MLSQSRAISHGLILMSFAVLSLHHVSGRSVKPISYGYELGAPIVVADEDADLSISAAEPRPVFVELVKRPLSLPLVAGAGTVSAQSEAPVISASEKVEKILRRPMAFSYTTDQSNAASDLIANSPKEQLQGDESKHSVDQQAAAIDYYKYLTRAQGEDKDGAGLTKDNLELKKEASTNKKQEVAQDKDKSELRAKSRPDIFLSYSPSTFHKYTHKPAVESQSGKSDGGHHYHHAARADVGGKAEASESHEQHKEQGHGDNQASGSNDGDKEEVQASATQHGGGGGGDGNYKKGGGREYESVNQGEHGEHGEKKYSGYHQHDKGEKGHKDKDDHQNEYQEETGHKTGHHDEDGYEAQQQHGEEGQRGTQFHEEGEHSKGHSTQGEHNIHKKDEFEKKQEFYDESHEGGEHEKHGEYFHEDDYNKGGHHKSEHHKGGEQQEQYGSQKQNEEGGHEHEDKGHKTAIGREVHHDHQEKEGDEGNEQGGKRWHYQHGSGNGGGHDDSKGAHQHLQPVTEDGHVEASDHGNSENNKAANDQEGHGSNQAQTTKDQVDPSHDAFSYTGLEIYHQQAGIQQPDASNLQPTLDAGHGQAALLQNVDGQAQQATNFADINYGLLYGQQARPENGEQQPNNNAGNTYAADSVAYLTNIDQVHTENPLGGHIHADGHPCTGNSPAEAATTYSQQVATPIDSQQSESHGQAEESAPTSHILVVGSDGNIYGLITNSDNLLAETA